MYTSNTTKHKDNRVSERPDIIDTDDVVAIKRAVTLCFNAFSCIFAVKYPEDTAVVSCCAEKSTD